MGTIGKGFSILLVVILAASSLIMVESASAQSIPKPSVPDFTVRYVDHSYDVPAYTSVDPYTGKTVTNPAHHVINYTIQFTLKNQTYDSSLDLFYNIRVKPHYQEDNWTTLYGREYGPRVTNTDLTLIFSCNSNDSIYRNFYRDWAEIYAPQGGQIDAQVETFQAGEDYYQSASNPMGSWIWTIRVESGWSNTQTITIPETFTSTSTTPTPTPTMPNYGPTSAPTPTSTVPEFSFWTIPLLLTITLALAVLSVYRKKQKQ